MRSPVSKKFNMADEKLRIWCSQELSKFTDCAEEITDYVLSISEPNDVGEYLSGILDPENETHHEFIQKFVKALRGRRPAGYDQGSVASTTKETTPMKKGVASHKAEGVETKKKNARFVPLYSSEGQARASVRLPGRHPCECLGQKHAIVNNCIKCGRIVCEQEGSGPCYFCGSLVCTKEEQEILARNSKKSMKLYEKLVTQKIAQDGPDSQGKGADPSKGLQKALAHKERLLEYDRSSVRRTKVIDDESDYFTTDGNQWLSKKEREALKEKEEMLRQKRHGSRRGVKVTIDFAGRKVVSESDGDSMYQNGDELLPASIPYGSGDVPKRSYPSISADMDLKFLPTTTETSSKLRPTNHMQGNKPTNQVLRVQDRELQEMSDEGMCLSMHQPWASLLVLGIKKVEGRSWYTAHRGRLWIAAAAKAATKEEISSVEEFYHHYYGSNLEFPAEYPTSCLLGCVEVVDCLSQEEYRELDPDGESTSPFVFVCENPQQLVVKFPIKGKHKIWKIEPHIHKAVKRGLKGVR